MNNNQPHSIILEASRKTGVPVKKIQDMLYRLSSNGAMDNNELAKGLGVSRNALNQVKLYLSDYLKPSSGHTQLSTGKMGDIKKMFLNGEYFLEEALFNLLENEHYKKNVAFLNGIAEVRPSPNREYDQFTATVETTARRAELLKFFGDIEGKRVLFLGDDDFTSVVIGRYKVAKDITVLDIDERILGGIEKISTQQNLGIKIVKYDARKGLPQEFSHSYDVVFTDPPYTSDGVRLFISRAVEALDLQNESARLYLCYGNSDRAKERFLPIYSSLIDSGLMIRWVLDKFNRYHGAESIGNSSSLFICDVTAKTKPLIHANYDKPIYTDN